MTKGKIVEVWLSLVSKRLQCGVINVKKKGRVRCLQEVFAAAGIIVAEEVWKRPTSAQLPELMQSYMLVHRFTILRLGVVLEDQHNLLIY